MNELNFQKNDDEVDASVVSEEPLESGTSLHSRILCFGGSRSNSSSGNPYPGVVNHTRNVEPSQTNKHSAGEVMKNFNPHIQPSSSHMKTVTVTQVATSETNSNKDAAGKVLQSFNYINSSTNEKGDSKDNTSLTEPDAGVTESIKHFFPDSTSYQVDAGTINQGSGVGVSSSTSNQSVSASLDDEFRYRMDYPERGCFLIFNQEKFDLYNAKASKDNKPLSPRPGTDKDARNLEFVAHHIGFEYVRTIKDATSAQIKNVIQKVAEADHSNYDCFACAILTHGGDKDILYARDEAMKLTDFTRPFGADRCRTLAMKPKLFFIQACRGENVDEGATVKSDDLSDCIQSDSCIPSPDDVPDGFTDQEVTIPAEADFLIANSTCPGYYAFRNQANGSIFVQLIYSVFISNGSSMELLKMMTRLNRMMAYDFVSFCKNYPKFNNKKQIPSIATRLTAELYFTPKKTIPPAFQASEPSPNTLNQPSSSTSVEADPNHTTDGCDNESPFSIQESVEQLATDHEFEIRFKIKKSYAGIAFRVMLSYGRIFLHLPWGPIDLRSFYCF